MNERLYLNILLGFLSKLEHLENKVDLLFKLSILKFLQWGNKVTEPDVGAFLSQDHESNSVEEEQLFAIKELLAPNGLFLDHRFLLICRIFLINVLLPLHFRYEVCLQLVAKKSTVVVNKNFNQVNALPDGVDVIQLGVLLLK